MRSLLLHPSVDPWPRGNHTGRYTRIVCASEGSSIQRPALDARRGTGLEVTPLTPAGERLLDAAAELFYRRGIRAVGVDLIADVAGTTKKTLYDRFGSKDALVALYLRRRAQRWQVFVREFVGRTPPGPDQLLAVFDALEEWLAEQDRGCAFVNAHAEIGGTDHPGVPVIRAEKAAMRALFTELAVGGGAGRARGPRRAAAPALRGRQRRGDGGRAGRRDRPGPPRRDPAARRLTALFTHLRCAPLLWD